MTTNIRTALSLLAAAILGVSIVAVHSHFHPAMQWDNFNERADAIALHNARVYAWAWHDRRHALSLRDEARLGLPMMPMSGYLALTDDECTAGEAVAGPGILGSGIDYSTDEGCLDSEDPEVGALIEAHARDKAAQGRYANP